MAPIDCGAVIVTTLQRCYTSVVEQSEKLYSEELVLIPQSLDCVLLTWVWLLPVRTMITYIWSVIWLLEVATMGIVNDGRLICLAPEI